MTATLDISGKISSYKDKTYFNQLDKQTQKCILDITESYHLTFQEFRQLTEAANDLHMWEEQPLHAWWRENISVQEKRKEKKEIFMQLNDHLRELKNTAKEYSAAGLHKPKKREKGKIVLKETDKNIFGMCPVASPKTVCCNLKTIDAVENCIFGCSYCTIQTFYHNETVFDARLPEKLKAIQLDPQRRYHIGTGQSSDSLAWGNKHGNLDALCAFAQNNPNVMLEFKTKSDNIAYFLENDTPANIVCSWSLNPQIIIDNEEHFTASLEKRIKAARAVADRGVKVSFHFHPIVYYSEWKSSYPAIADRIQHMFQPQEVLFVSFGSVTFIKPVLKKIRRLGLPTKITQMELVSDPHGKMTYPDAIKIEKFSTMYQAFKNWHDKVFFYLCMEKASLWEQSLGFVYPDNGTFEQEMLEHCFKKINKQQAIENYEL